MVFIYITCKDKKEAKTISAHLLEKKLIACANFFPIGSMYKWKGKLVEEREYALLCKTQKKHYTSIKKEATSLHSYEVPCICLIESQSNSPFTRWVSEST